MHAAEEWWAKCAHYRLLQQFCTDHLRQVKSPQSLDLLCRPWCRIPDRPLLKTMCSKNRLSWKFECGPKQSADQYPQFWILLQSSHAGPHLLHRHRRNLLGSHALWNANLSKVVANEQGYSPCRRFRSWEEVKWQKTNFGKWFVTTISSIENTHDDKPWTLECNIRHKNLFKSAKTHAYYHITSSLRRDLVYRGYTFVNMRTQRGTQPEKS